MSYDEKEPGTSYHPVGGIPADEKWKALLGPRELKKELWGEPDMVYQPSHYIFPGGVEVIQLSRHLTSNGGQAIQYVARATRLDGNVKGDPIEDLEKAIVFLQDEIERLGGK